MCKRFNRVLAIGVSSVLLILCGNTALAQELSKSQEVQVETFEEVTDVDELIAIGLEQLAAQPCALSLENEEESTVLEVSQLLSRTVYPDGTEEREYVVSGITVLDQEGNAVLVSELAKAADSTITDQQTGSKNGIVVVVNMYTTMRVQGALQITFRFDKMITYIHNENNSSTPPTKVVNMYWHSGVGHTANNTKYLEATTPLQSSTLISQHSQFEESREYTYSWICQGDVYLSNGSNITVTALVNTNKLP